MAPFKSSGGRSLGKLLEGFKTSTLGQGFGSGSGSPGIFLATGGDIASVKEPGNGYAYHTFGTPGTFEVQLGDTLVDILVVAGGGGGGGRAGGGGGAGGVVYIDRVPLSVGTYPVVVGPGGAGAGQPGHPQYPANQGSSPHVGASGSNSYFGAPGVAIGGQPNHFLAKGGGGGGNANSNTSYGSPGGSSGGSGYGENNPQTADQPGTNPSSFATDYGFKGGRGTAGSTYNCGGGGGAAAEGGPGVPKHGDGGAGQPFPSFYYPDCFPNAFLPNLTPRSPDNTHYGGGGGGGGHPPFGPQGIGGFGGGGNGGAPGGPYSEGGSAGGTQAGANYLGGGGGGTTTNGGGGQNYWGQPGGIGVVIVRYPKNW